MRISLGKLASEIVGVATLESHTDAPLCRYETGDYFIQGITKLVEPGPDMSNRICMPFKKSVVVDHCSHPLAWGISYAAL